MQIRAAADSKYGYAFHNWQDLKGKPPALDGRFSMLETKRRRMGQRVQGPTLKSAVRLFPIRWIYLGNFHFVSIKIRVQLPGAIRTNAMRKSGKRML